jgi:hypothetical protein
MRRLFFVTTLLLGAYGQGWAGSSQAVLTKRGNQVWTPVGANVQMLPQVTHNGFTTGTCAGASCGAVINVPAHATGDCLIAYVVGTVASPTCPAGWTNPAASQESNTEFSNMCFRVATSSEPASYTWPTGAGSTNVTGTVGAFHSVANCTTAVYTPSKTTAITTGLQIPAPTETPATNEAYYACWSTSAAAAIVLPADLDPQPVITSNENISCGVKSFNTDIAETATNGATSSRWNAAAVNLTPAPTGTSWKLIFDDEFNGPTLNTAIWNPSWFGATVTTVTVPIVGCCETAAYDPAEIRIVNGMLELSTIAAPITVGSAFSFRAGHIDSNSTWNIAAQASSGFGFQVSPPAYVEARMWVPPAPGGYIANWPAFWLAGIYGTFPADGEIDIAEALWPTGSPNMNTTMCQNYHSPPGNVTNCTSGPSGGPGWHIYGVLWTVNEVDYYYDGKLVKTYSTAGGNGIASIPEYLNFGNQMGTLGGATVVPTTMLVDYVHVYSTDPTIAAVIPQRNYGGPGDKGKRLH